MLRWKKVTETHHIVFLELDSKKDAFKQCLRPLSFPAAKLLSHIQAKETVDTFKGKKYLVSKRCVFDNTLIFLYNLPENEAKNAYTFVLFTDDETFKTVTYDDISRIFENTSAITVTLIGYPAAQKPLSAQQTEFQMLRSSLSQHNVTISNLNSPSQNNDVQTVQFKEEPTLITSHSTV